MVYVFLYLEIDYIFILVILIFSGRYNGHHVPLIYALTMKKTAETYNGILGALLDLEPNINPTDVMTDFEMAAINAVKINFPLAETHGCLFHFGQSIWRHIQLVGLQSVYNEDANFAFQLRLLVALAFLPVECISDAYDELIATDFFDGPNEHKNAIEELLTYFQTTYVYGFDRFGKKKDPLFPPALWCVFALVLSGKFFYLFSEGKIKFNK